MERKPENIEVIEEVNILLDKINKSKTDEFIAMQIEKHPEPTPEEKCSKEEWQEKLRQGWTKLLDDKEVRNNCIQAFEIISDDLSRKLSKIEYHEIQKEWQHAIDKLNANLKSINVSKNIQESDKQLNELCGISETTLAHFYEVGVRLYDEQKFKEAEVVFRLIITLNTRKENVWLSLGLCQKQLSLNVLAVFSFAMAIMMNSHNILPYIYSAECYLAEHEHHDAKECLISAQEMLEQEKGERRQIFNDYIHSLLKQC